MSIYPTGPNGLWVFLLITVLMGGSAAWVTGKAVAQTWRPLYQLLVYAGLLVFGVRFLHYALFYEPLLPLRNWAVDYTVLFVLAALGFRRMRALQVSTQYSWLFEPSGPLGWRRRPTAPRYSAESK